MEFTDKIHLEITPLTKTEQDQLTGGFVSSQIKSEKGYAMAIVRTQVLGLMVIADAMHVNRHKKLNKNYNN